jgi:LAS superfamily LD-carboxypeptidase LdcB
MIDGRFLTSNKELMEHEDVYLEIHKYISQFGFILRYLKGKEDITGYPYEPWHIRYIGDSKIAKYIYENHLTLEEYLMKRD